MSAPKSHQKKTAYRCPDCGSPLRIRDSKGIHVLMRSTVLQCTNDVTCGATFSGRHEICYRFVPSAMPNPDINLPTAPGWIVRNAKKSLREVENEQQIDFLEDYGDEESEENHSA